MVRRRKGIEMLVNLINISYCAMKLLPYMEETLSQYRGGSVQEFRFALSEQIRRQIFYVNLEQNIETHIKSKLVIYSPIIKQNRYFLYSLCLFRALFSWYIISSASRT